MDVLKGRILERVTIKGTLTDTIKMSGGLNIPETIYPPAYSGSYSITPTNETQVLQTNETYLLNDITIDPIPNNYGLITWNGSTLTVS